MLARDSEQNRSIICVGNSTQDQGEVVRIGESRINVDEEKAGTRNQFLRHAKNDRVGSGHRVLGSNTNGAVRKIGRNLAAGMRIEADFRGNRVLNLESKTVKGLREIEKHARYVISRVTTINDRLFNLTESRIR